MKPVISVEYLSKQYDLGVISSGTLSRDLTRWWARVRGKQDPYSRIGQRDAFEAIGESILALDDVSFKVNQGDTLGIIGRNGAGKSTLLKILSRVTAPSSGLVKVKGRIGSLLEVGTGFHPELTGRENVFLNGAILGMRKDEVSKKFDEIVDFSGVEKFIDTPVKRYSSGMYVRLAFAVAAHLDPEILIVDEVLAVGDAEFQKKCLGKMGDVAGEGRTVLFVSHNMGAIQTLCNSAIVLADGKITYEGSSPKAVSFYYDSISSDNAKDWVEADRRNGDGRIRISDAILTDSNGEILEAITVGQAVNFEIGYIAKENFNLADVNFEVRCFDHLTNNPFFLQSMRQNEIGFEGQLPEKGKVCLSIDSLPILPRTCRFELVVKVNNIEADYILNGFILEILENGDTRKKFGEMFRYPFFDIPGKWTLTK